MAHEIKTEFTADTSRLRAGVNNAQSSIGKFATSAKNMMKNLGVGITAVAGGLTAFGYIAKNLIDDFDSFNDLSEKLGLTTTEVQKLSQAAKMGGTDIETLNGVLLKMEQNMSDPDKIDKTTKALKNLGINIKQFNASSTINQLAMLSDAMKNGGNLNDIFAVTGKGGANIMSMLRSGGDKIRGSYNDASVVSKVNMEKIAEFNDQLDKATNDIKVKLISNVIMPLINHFGGLSYVSKILSESFVTMAQVFILIKGVMMSIIKGLEGVFTSFASIAYGMIGMMQKAFIKLKELVGAEVTKDDKTEAKNNERTSLILRRRADKMIEKSYTGFKNSLTESVDFGKGFKKNEAVSNSREKAINAADEVFGKVFKMQAQKEAQKQYNEEQATKFKEHVQKLSESFKDFGQKYMNNWVKKLQKNEEERKKAERIQFNKEATPNIFTNLGRVGGEAGYFKGLQNNLQKQTNNLLTKIEKNTRTKGVVGTAVYS